MNKMMTTAIKVTLTVGALAAALAGCCWGKSGTCCCKCCDKEPCCEKSCCDTPDGGKKSHGMDASVTLGAGTGGVHAGVGGSMK